MDKKKLGVAIGFLSLSTLVAARGVMSVLADTPPPDSVTENRVEEGPEQVATIDEPRSDEAGHLSADLVALHGSLDANERVRDAFGVADSGFVEGVEQPEVEAQPVSAWPRHHVSLVLLAGERHSAVVDLSVVTVGESIAAGTVLSIAEEAVRVETADGGVLVYALAPQAIDPVIEEQLGEPVLVDPTQALTEDLPPSVGNEAQGDDD